jgi:cystathionine beta-lyase
VSAAPTGEDEDKAGADGAALAPATRLAHAGRRPEWTHGVVNPPVYHASTCTFQTLDAFDERLADPDGGLYYGRRGTPTHWALEEALTEMEPGAGGTKLFPSGVAAIATALMAVVKTGDHVLIADSVYEPTRAMAKGLLARIGAEAEFYDPLIGDGIAELFRDNTAALYMESPGSLTFEVQDVPALCTAAKARGIATILDNTWATPLLFPALARGIDISVQSLTKFVVGHSDAMLGSVSATEEYLPRVKAMTYRLGQTAGPDDVALGLRGLRTLAARMDRHGRSALTVARALAEHRAVARVLCPGLPDDPHHALWQRDFAGYSSIFSIELAGGERAHLAAMIDPLRLFSMGFSFGGYESLVLPVNPAPLRTATSFAQGGPIVRIHVGLEEPDDLIRDLIAGLDRFADAAGLR